MLQPQLNSLDAFINQYNTYFDRSFPSVEKTDSGILHDGNERIFPNDIYGNYFYLRVPSMLTISYLNPIADNGLSLRVTAKLSLVAFFVDGDANDLALNLMSTVGRYTEETKITSVLIHKEDVISQELKGCTDETIARALQNIDNNVALCAINFDLTFYQSLLQLNCIEKPCKSC